jgi:DNA-binding MarR family transcriptional regulator
MTTEETNALAVQIRVLAAVVSKMAMRDLEQRLEARQAGVSGLQYGVLGHLRRESATLSDLSRKLSLAPATLVPVVDALEVKGLVQRGRDPLDRRRVPLYLTVAGEATLDRLPLVDSDDSLVRSITDMGTARACSLFDLLHELANRMSTGQGAPVALEAELHGD